MIHEFAVEPGLLNTWGQFQYITEKFGFHQGRLISKFPSKWKKMVHESLVGVSELEKKRIVEKLSTIDVKMIGRRHTGQNELPWLEHAEQEHRQQPFHAILALANPRRHSDVLCYQDLDEALPLWNTPHQQIALRTPESLANALAPVFRAAKQIVFIDSYFGALNKSAIDALTAYLKHCKPLDPYPEILFLTCDRGNVNFQVKCQQEFGRLLPTGKKITLTYCEEQTGADGLHNRYVLTDRGGVILGWGLGAGKPGQKDDVSLMDPAVYEQRWGQYCGTNPIFRRTLTFCVHGNAPQ